MLLREPKILPMAAKKSHAQARLLRTQAIFRHPQPMFLPLPAIVPRRQGRLLLLLATPLRRDRGRGPAGARCRVRWNVLAMQVTLDLPDDISAVLEGRWPDLPRQALEALAVEAYRTGALTNRRSGVSFDWRRGSKCTRSSRITASRCATAKRTSRTIQRHQTRRRCGLREAHAATKIDCRVVGAIAPVSTFPPAPVRRLVWR